MPSVKRQRESFGTTNENAAPIINSLRSQAATLLHAALGTATLDPFATTSLGNFPYYWRDDTNTRFNQKTYNWIVSGLKADVSPVEQDGVFTNLYNQAISAISYSYSKADQLAVNKGMSAASTQQGQFLTAWTNAGNELPSGNQPLNAILATIQTTWANPSTTLMAMK